MESQLSTTGDRDTPRHQTEQLVDTHENHAESRTVVEVDAASEPPSGVWAQSDAAQGPSSQVEQPYSIYITWEKWFIVSAAAFASVFSPLVGTIYFPAIPVLASAFNKSVELINLTVTVYMVLQGISPMFWGTLADRWGRRPMFLACTLVLALSCVGLALVPTNMYWLLMLLRCIQAAGSASTIALGAGVIGDIAAQYERGKFFGVWNIGPMAGPCIGPVLGGLLAQGLGWRSIFWFICIASALCFAFLLAFLPETLRAIVGDGSIPPPPLYKPLIPVIGRNRPNSVLVVKVPRKKFQNPLRLFLYPDVALLLLYNAILYSVFYAVTASISTLFQSVYPWLSEIETGLCFLSIGGGMLIGGVITGRLLDWDYRRIKEKLMRSAVAEDSGEKMRPEDVTREEHFPIERARLRMMPIYFTISLVSCIGYGWCLDQKVSIAGPLVLLFIYGWACVAIMNIVSTTLVDLAPEMSSSITACNNLCRCSFGAVCVSVIDLILNAIGAGWTYVLLAGPCVLVFPTIFVVMLKGPKWRESRRARRQPSP
ncbi:MFS general substrate transporter [Obba rivulosa]|uniref:MFS general substrate transporter n=1 Tax=Obba rivulosa TaxID=1052685 RepID=A0A8E2AQ43_9APHY|nr:MFS general substrate transporter [Obba rivulosa]